MRRTPGGVEVRGARGRAATVVAHGASNTYGKGVRARSAANDIELF